MQSFNVNIAQSILDDLKNRIKSTRWPDGSPGTGWQQGIPIEEMQQLAAWWTDRFDWRQTENKINAWPNVMTVIDGCQLHFLHIRGKGQKTVPLIITHGWPGSFLEIINCIPLLTEGDDMTFDLVIPSVPGFGFSEKPAREGVNAECIAAMWVKLMKALGYDRFFAQGGDFGAEISSRMALNHPDHVAGLHLNYIPFSYKPYLPPGEKLTQEETAAQQQSAAFFQVEGSYAQQQVTKPRTLSYGLNDSPVGLAAWILQIFKSFSDPTRSLTELFNADELLANITLYWITGTIPSSIRIYGEAVKNPLVFKKDDFIQPPVGIAHYPFPSHFPARKYVERGYNVQYWSDLPAGGHFAAMEQPQIFSNDIRAFVKSVIRD